MKIINDGLISISSPVITHTAITDAEEPFERLHRHVKGYKHAENLA